MPCFGRVESGAPPENGSGCFGKLVGYRNLLSKGLAGRGAGIAGLLWKLSLAGHEGQKEGSKS